MTDIECAIYASIAAERALKGETLSSSDVEVMRRYAETTTALTGNQRRVFIAVLESHERLRVEKLLVNIL